jgi:hypothetical protein
MRFTSDSATILLAREAAVASRFQKLFPKIIVCHSSNYRIEFAVSGDIEEIR